MEITSVNIEDLPGPQSLLAQQMAQFNDSYRRNKDIKAAVEMYDEEANGPRFQTPIYCSALGGVYPAAQALRFRVWHKGTDPENPGSSQCQEFATLQDALTGRIDIIESGYQYVDLPIGVCWDNAMGCFAEFQITEVVQNLEQKN